MDFVRLERLGWTKAEMRKVRTILRRAEKKKSKEIHVIEHVMLWLTVFTLIAGSLAIIIMIMPLLLLGAPLLTIPVVFVLGTCLGLLFVHVLHDLKLERVHHHLGALVLLTGVLAGIGMSLVHLPGRFSVEQTFETTVVITLSFAAGILIPYVAHWRISNETH